MGRAGLSGGARIAGGDRRVEWGTAFPQSRLCLSGILMMCLCSACCGLVNASFPECIQEENMKAEGMIHERERIETDML